MLQAIDRMDVPIKAMAAGAVVKLVANFIFVSIPKINIQGAVIGTFLCNVVMVVWFLVVIARETELKYNWSADVIRPLIASALSGVAAFVTRALFVKILPDGRIGPLPSVVSGPNISTLIAVGAAVVVYAIALFALRAVTKEDIYMLPKGEKVAKVLEKYRLIG